MTSSTGSGTPPWIYFFAGMLVPSLAWLLLRSRPSSIEDDEEDEDTMGTSTGGPSSKWGYTNAPYKVSLIRVLLTMEYSISLLSTRVPHLN